MTRGQRWIILIGVPLVAWMLHTSLCEWQYKSPRRGRSNDFIFLNWEHADPITVQSNTFFPGAQGGNTPVMAPPVQRTAYTGLYPDGGVPRVIAALFGVVLPLIMLATIAWLWLGWRRADRIANGLCIKCGHDLRGLEHDKCPECGAAVQSELVTATTK